MLGFIEDVVAVLQHPVAGRVIADVVAEARRSLELAEALDARYRQPRRAAGAAMLERALKRGELPPDADVDVDLALDLLAGPLYLRAVTVGDQQTASMHSDSPTHSYVPSGPKASQPALERR